MRIIWSRTGTSASAHAASLPTPGGPLLAYSRREETRVQIPAAAHLSHNASESGSLRRFAAAIDSPSSKGTSPASHRDPDTDRSQWSMVQPCLASRRFRSSQKLRKRFACRPENYYSVTERLSHFKEQLEPLNSCPELNRYPSRIAV